MGWRSLVLLLTALLCWPSTNQSTFTSLTEFNTSIFVTGLDSFGNTIGIASSLGVFLSVNNFTSIKEVVLPGNTLSVLAICTSKKDPRLFVALNGNKIQVVDMNTGNLTFVVNFVHPYLKEFLVTRLLWTQTIDSSEWLITISDMSEDLLFLHPLGTVTPVWTTTGSKPLKEISASPRVLIAMPEQGSSLIQIDMSTKLVRGETTTLASPGFALYQIAYYEQYPAFDLFFSTHSDGFVTTAITLFDGASTFLTNHTNYGSWAEPPRFLKHLRGTNYLVVGGIASLLYVDLTSRRLTTVVMPGRIGEWTQISNSSLSAIFLKENRKFILGEVVGGLGCIESCTKCLKAASNTSCLECAAGFTLTGTGGCSSTCTAGQAFKLETQKCEPLDLKSSFSYVTNQSISTPIQNCLLSAPHKMACLQCTDSFKVSNGTCISIDSCPDSTVNTDKYACLQCNKVCLDCYDKESNSCLVCKAGFNIVNSKCLSNCALGYFYNIHEGECTQCYEGCDRCLAYDELKCQRCTGGMYLNGGFCYEVCPDGFIPNDSTRTCNPCKDSDCAPCTSPQVSFRGRCYNNCPENTGTFDKQSCYPCYDYKCRYLRLSSTYIIRTLDGNPTDPNTIRDDNYKKELTAAVVITSILLAGIFLALIFFGILKCCELRKQKKNTNDTIGPDPKFSELFNLKPEPSNANQD